SVPLACRLIAPTRKGRIVLRQDVLHETLLVPTILRPSIPRKSINTRLSAASWFLPPGGKQINIELRIPKVHEGKYRRVGLPVLGLRPSSPEESARALRRQLRE